MWKKGRHDPQIRSRKKEVLRSGDDEKYREQRQWDLELPRMTFGHFHSSDTIIRPQDGGPGYP